MAGQRRPGRAIEPELLAGEEPAACRQRLEERALLPEAGLLQHTPRGRVDDACVGIDRRHVDKREQRVDQRLHGLRRKALAPMRRAEPVADEGDARRLPVRADHADQLVGLGARRDRQHEMLAQRIALAHREDEGLHRIDRVGMWDSGRHLGHGFLSRETQDGGSIGHAGPAQPETAGLEPEDIVAGQFGEHRSLRRRKRKKELGFCPTSPFP